MMNSIERMSALALLILAGAFCLVAAGDFKEDIAQLAQADNGPVFDEDQDGFDKHSDIFYYQDEKVEREYARSNYLSTQVTLAGQKPDLTERKVKPAVRPFAIAQRTFKPLGYLMDRWDVKDTGNEAQYFGLYHGKNQDFVVNKVRAHLLRELANAVNDLLPALDRTAEEDAQQHPEDVEEIRDNVRATIERVFREVDDSIRRQSKDNDDGKASATVVIVSKNFVITANVGQGTVIGYGDKDDDYYVHSYLVDPTSQEQNNLFGSKWSRGEPLQPRVEFYSRLETQFKFLLIETPAVSSTVPMANAIKTVLSSINRHKYVEEHEQELYSSAVMYILNEVSTTVSPFRRFFSHSDYSVILVGLDTNYSEIH